jgi:hypothetical protein
LLLAFLSLLVLATSAPLLALSATVPAFLASTALYTLGTGFPIAAQVYVAALVPAARLARVLALLALAATGAKVVASTLFPAVFAWGLDRGGVWVGAPFLMAGGLFGLAGLAVAGLGLGWWAQRGKSEGGGE